MKINIVTLDGFTNKMAGPAIRVWEMARVLSSSHEVRVLAFGETSRTSPDFEVIHTSVLKFKRHFGNPDLVIFQGYLSETFPWLLSGDFLTVVDLYDPFHIESLEAGKDSFKVYEDQHLDRAIGELNRQIAGGDFFICSSERQRDMWLGYLSALGRVSPRTYGEDPTLRQLIDVASFGLSVTPPEHSEPVIRGVVEGIGESDPLVIWTGGVYNWFDPLTVIRAIDKVRETIPNIRLFFMGVSHPNPAVPRMRMLTEARSLSDSLGLTNRHVFFNEDWVDYDKRGAYLLEADVGISAHFDTIETDFSFRTRMLDYLWAGLPIVTTSGDFFADLVGTHELGRVVPCQSVELVTEALLELLQDRGTREQCAQNVRRVAPRFQWESTLEPLVKFCETSSVKYRPGRKGIRDAFLAMRRLPLSNRLEVILPP